MTENKSGNKSKLCLVLKLSFKSQEISCSLSFIKDRC